MPDMSPDARRHVEALIQVGLRLTRSAPSGRILLARLADAVDPAWISGLGGEHFAVELQAARTAASEPLEANAIEHALRVAWGAAPTEELDELDPDPVAVTPSSQVHRGVLAGSPVAVKVLRPGLAASVRQDLALFEGLLSPLHAAFPSVDAGAVLRELRERALDELDLEHEALAQRHFHRALRNHPFLTVPAPVTRLARESVLVSEWVPGVPLWRAPDPDQAASRLVVFVLGCARSGYVHADPNPDDVLALEDGRLAILDFGATRSVSPARADIASVALEGFVAEDPGALGAALEQLGWLPSNRAAAVLELGLEVLGELAGADPTRLDGHAIIAAGERLLARPEAMTELIVAGALPPQDLWPARAVAQLFATIARVGATGTWRELARAALREGWNAPAN
jgi:predicted unusual protein kinase regulating ubiquinone biosynthesis (AarF/ABC1/UbiB family)